jgi:hypothetical protein
MKIAANISFEKWRSSNTWKELTSLNYIYKGIKSRLNSGNACYRALEVGNSEHGETRNEYKILVAKSERRD